MKLKLKSLSIINGELVIEVEEVQDEPAGGEAPGGDAGAGSGPG
jgi:hypothetical protein